MFRRSLLVVGVALLMAVSMGCSSDPVATDEYIELQQEFETARANLVAAEQELAERSAVEGETDSGSIAAPPQLATLVDDWFAALERGDGSVLDLYVAEGYHLYGDERFEYDEIVEHLSAGPIKHEWITDTILVVEDADGRYVVTRGMRNTSPIWTNASALMFEIVTTPDDQLRLVQTAWFYDSEWQADDS